MNNASGHFAILAAAGVAAVLLSALTAIGRWTEARDAEQATVVVTLPQRSSEPAARPPAKPQPATTVVPGDRASLTRALQSELKRVGCYDGDVSGVWNTRSRAAMKAFTERVNATLPVDNPDQILLALVRGHRTRACDAATCPSGQMPAADGRCLPGAAIARDAERPAPAETAVAGKDEPKVTIVPPPPVLATRKAAPPPAVPIPRIAERRPPPTEPSATPAPPPSQPREADQGGPVPPVGIYDRERHHRHVIGKIPKPVAIARSLLRKLQRAAQAAAW